MCEEFQTLRSVTDALCSVEASNVDSTYIHYILIGETLSGQRQNIIMYLNSILCDLH